MAGTGHGIMLPPPGPERQAAIEKLIPPKECKGKSAARTLLMMVLDPKINAFLRENDPKALEQAEEALKPFGYPDAKALMEKFKA
jgi:hypothetical protein